MPDSIFKDGPRRRKGQSENSLAPVLVADGVYTRDQVLAIFGISAATLAAMIKDGLDVLLPAVRTKALKTGTPYFFYGGDLIDYMRRQKE